MDILFKNIHIFSLFLCKVVHDFLHNFGQHVKYKNNKLCDNRIACTVYRNLATQHI